LKEEEEKKEEEDRRRKKNLRKEEESEGHMCAGHSSSIVARQLPIKLSARY